MNNPRQEYRPRNGKIPHGQEHVSYKSCSPKWLFARFDKTDKEWGLASGKWDKVIESLMGYEQMTWGEIETASGGKKSGSNSHFIPIYRLGKRAQNRIDYLKLSSTGRGIDEVFSLRITGSHRLFGILEDDGSFYILWNDVRHTVYPL